MKPTLWTKNFTIITLGTVASAIGGSAMNFALSLVVYDQSQSTFLTGLFSAVALLPQLVLPLVAGPWLDRFRRKPIIVGLDFLSGLLYLIFGAYLLGAPFQFSLYLIFAFVVGCIGAVYELAYTSLYPNLIPEGFSQKGYTVSGMIYPTVTVLITPAAAFFYVRFGLPAICLGEGVLLLLSSLLETQIRVKEKVGERRSFCWQEYRNDLAQAWQYLKKQKGLLRIYGYMPITQGIGMGCSTLLVAWFQSTPGLGAERYSLFTAAEFVGRTLGGVVHYRFEIPAKRRSSFAYFVYQRYSVMDGILLLLPYPLMMLNRAICGFLGINSATLRESSVQNYIPDHMRAKLNSFFSMLMGASVVVFRLLIGAVGEIFPAPACVLFFAVLNIVLCYLIVYRGSGKTDVQQVYNHIY